MFCPELWRCSRSSTSLYWSLYSRDTSLVWSRSSTVVWTHWNHGDIANWQVSQRKRGEEKGRGGGGGEEKGRGRREREGEGEKRRVGEKRKGGGGGEEKGRGRGMCKREAKGESLTTRYCSGFPEGLACLGCRLWQAVAESASCLLPCCVHCPQTPSTTQQSLQRTPDTWTTN